MDNKKLKGKDVITIGIFTAIYFAINFRFMLLGGLHTFLKIENYLTLKNQDF